MGFSHEYSDVPDWVEKPEGYQTGDMVKYKGNIFKANFWASKPGEGDANENGWRLYDELYDVTSSPAAGPAKIIGYIPTWRKTEGFNYAEEEMYLNITHGVVAFLMFDRSNLGGFESKSVDDVEAVIDDIVDTGHRCGTKILIALGGATDYGFLDLMKRVGSNPSDSVLSKAVKNVVDFVKANDLDGVDLDLECWWDENNDASKDQGGRSKSDGAHPAGKGLTIFARELKKALPDKTISAALFATSWYGNCYDSGLAEYVEWIGVMTYDLTGSWNQSPVGPQTSLLKIREQEAYADEQQGKWPDSRRGKDSGDPMFNNPVLSVEDSLWYWTNPFFTNWQGEGQGVKRNKIVPGVPIYGYDFAHGKEPDDLSGQIAPGYKAIRYKDILEQFPNAATAKDANIKVGGSTPRPPFVSEPGSYPYAHNIYFETPQSATDKLNFLKKVGTQGVIIWELTNDVWEGENSIVKALYQSSENPPKQAKPAKPDKEDPDKDESDDSNLPLKEMHGNKIYLVHEGRGASGEVWTFNSSDLRDRRVVEARPPAQVVMGTSRPPAIANYNGTFFIAREDRGNTGDLLVASSQVVEEPSGEFNLEMPERPGASYNALDRHDTALNNHQPFRDDRHPVEVMRHHIIPDRLLNEFWNTLLAVGSLNLTAGGLLRGLEESAENNRMNLNGADRREVVQLLQSIRSGRIRHNPSARRPLGFDTLAAVYEWMPGNLFIGPRGGGGQYQRTDDPQDGFEVNARVVVGPAFANMENANSLIRDFTRTSNTRTGTQAAIALSRLTQRKQPYDIDGDNWIFKGGKYRLRKPGD